jgi:four helix bundle protein
LLRAIVAEHLETFLAEARRRGSGDGVPAFVERELREFLTCGVLANGFARFRCRDCFREVLVAFSCQGRGFCPSCCGRRMAERAAHLVDGVLGGLPVRQWVLTLPHRLRYALAWDHRLCRAVLAVFIRAVLGFERRRARCGGHCHPALRLGAEHRIESGSESESVSESSVHMSFGHERLDVYRAALEYVAWAYACCERMTGHRHAKDQLRRASQAIPLNIAEGNGKATDGDRRRYFEIARGSALECGAVQDVLEICGALSAEESAAAKAVLDRIVAMLTKLGRRGYATRGGGGE